ncbi:hypothetical protein BH23ACT9_BH23ACT9_38620 [soil metagenome]
MARFGDAMTPTVDAIVGQLGSWQEDTGWEDGFSSSFGACSYPEVRGLRWGGFWAVFADDARGSALQNTRLVGYLQLGGQGTPPELATEAGLMLGATVSELRAI